MKDIFTLDRLRFLLAQLGITAGGGIESLTEASYNQATKKVTFTRNNGNTFTLDLATLQDVPPSVNTFADLPDALMNINKLIIVRTTTGIIGINRKQQGTYYSNGVSWESSRINFNALLTYYDNSNSGLVAVNVKTAIDELDSAVSTKAPITNPTFIGEISIGTASVSETELRILEGAVVSTAELNYLDGATGSIQGQLDAFTAAIMLKGLWDASAGTFPAGGSAQAGWSYVVSVSGTVDGIEFNENDRILAIVDNASATIFTNNWFKLDYTDEVISVFGRTGVIAAQSNDYTFAQIDKSSSSLADITTRNFSDLQNKPTTATGYSMVNGDFTGSVSATAIHSDGPIFSQDDKIQRDFFKWNSTNNQTLDQHFKTNIPVIGNVMFLINIVGYSFGSSAPLSVDLVGHASSGSSITNSGQTNHGGNGTFSTYTSSDGFVSIRITNISEHYIGLVFSASFVNPTAKVTAVMYDTRRGTPF